MSGPHGVRKPRAGQPISVQAHLFGRKHIEIRVQPRARIRERCAVSDAARAAVQRDCPAMFRAANFAFLAIPASVGCVACR